MNNPQSIRQLVRNSLVVQIAAGVLIVAVVLIALVRSLSLVSEQERESRAVRGITEAAVSYLVANGIIGTAVDSRQENAAEQLRSVSVSFDAQFEKSIKDLNGEEASSASAIAAAVEQRETTVNSDALAALEAGSYSRAKAVLDSPDAGRTNSRIGSATTALLNTRVANQLREEQETKDIAIYVATAVGIAILTMTLVAAFFLLRIRRRVVPPLEDLDAVSVRIADGDFRARARPAGTLETVRAGDSFNVMADRVERNIVELRELDVLKDEFVAAVSHDLRTPLTVVRAYLDMYLAGEVEDEAERKACFDVISRNVDVLSELIDDLLTLTIIQSGGERAVNLQPVELDQLISEVERELRPTFDESEIKLDVSVAKHMSVIADPLRVHQVIENLLSNARKFSDAGSSVNLVAQPLNGVVEVSVEDHGVGIKPDDIDRIGERFFRADGADDVPGTGLGLAIVRELLELHGSQLKIESEPGVGTVANFTLPLAS